MFQCSVLSRHVQPNPVNFIENLSQSEVNRTIELLTDALLENLIEKNPKHTTFDVENFKTDVLPGLIGIFGGNGLSNGDIEHIKRTAEKDLGAAKSGEIEKIVLNLKMGSTEENRKMASVRMM